jgi:hypothetical protein
MCMCAIQRVNVKNKKHVYERGKVVGATGLCQELHCCWILHGHQIPVCIS